MRIKLDDSILYKKIFTSGLSGDTQLFSPGILNLIEKAQRIEGISLGKVFPESDIEVLCQFEREIHKQPIEHLGLFDYSGSLYMHTIGNENSAPLDEYLDDEDVLWYYIHNIAVATHNHPNGDVSFSPDDVAIACLLQLEELRVVCDNHYYTLRPNPDHRWSSEYFTEFIQAVVENTHHALKEEMLEKIRLGQISEHMADTLFWHNFWEMISGASGMIYTKRLYPDGKCVIENNMKELEFSGIGDDVGETRDIKFVDLLQKYAKKGIPQDNIDKYLTLAAKTINWDYKGLNTAINTLSNNKKGASSFLITERADNFSHGKPYMVTDLNKITGISVANSFINPDRIDDFRSKDDCIAINNKPSGFGNFQAVTVEPEYETTLFHTKQQAEQYVKNNSTTAFTDNLHSERICKIEQGSFNSRKTIQIYFKSKPDDIVLKQIKDKGFRWYKGYWGAFYTDSLWQWANDFCGGDAGTTTNNASILDSNSTKVDKKETTGKGSLPFIQHLIVNSIIFPDPDDTWAVKSETFIDGKGDIYIKETRISDKFHRDENGEFPTHDEWLKVGKAGGKQRSWLFGQVPDDIKPIDIPKKVFVPKEKRQPHYNLKYSDYKNRVILNSLILQQEIILGKMEFAKHRYFDGMVDGWEYIKKDEMNWHSSKKGLTDISYDEKPYHSGDNDIHWGSYYLRYNGRNAPEYIIFGSDAPQVKNEDRTYTESERKDIADKLKTKAEAMRDQARSKKNSGTHSQNWTRRRAAIMASQEKDAEILDEMADQFEKLAELWENDTVPNLLKGIRNKSELEIIRHKYYPQYDSTAQQWYIDEVIKKRNILEKIGINNKNDFDEAVYLLSNLINRAIDPEKDKLNKIKSMENQYRGQKIPGFFPTDNKDLADQLIELAEIRDGDTILEPSAGMGHLAQRIKELYPNNKLDVIEIRPGFVEILKEKGFNVVGSDFLEFTGSYDKIIMNPPFENNQDIEHVMHAFKLLNPGGKVVSIIGAGAIGGSLKIRQDFENFLNENEAYVSGTITDGFKNSFNSTGVAVKLIAVGKSVLRLIQSEAKIDEVIPDEETEETELVPDAVIDESDSSRPIFDLNDLDYDTAQKAYYAISFDPEKRGRQEQEFYLQDMTETYNKLLKLADTPEKEEILNREMRRYKANWINRYMAYLNAKGRTMSSMITGPSNFPKARNEKRMQSEDNRYKEWSEWRERAIKAIENEINPKVAATPEQEIDGLRSKIAKAKETHEKMKQINVILRKKGVSDEDLIKMLRDAGFGEKLIANAMTKNYSGKREIESWQLSNNLANIKRMEERLSELTKRASKATKEYNFPGGVVVDSNEEDRVMIIYDSKPDSATIEKLKRNGFKWSPSNKAWQRMRTPATYHVVSQMFDLVLNGNGNNEEFEDKSELIGRYKELMRKKTSRSLYEKEDYENAVSNFSKKSRDEMIETLSRMDYLNSGKSDSEIEREINRMDKYGMFDITKMGPKNALDDQLQPGLEDSNLSGGTTISDRLNNLDLLIKASLIKYKKKNVSYGTMRQE